MSVFAEPLAQAREAMSWLKPSRKRDEGMSALDLIEQRAKEMEAEVARVKNAENGVWGVVIANRELRSKNEALRARATDMEKALRQIANAEIDDRLDDLIHGSSLRKVARAALSAREENKETIEVTPDPSLTIRVNDVISNSHRDYGDETD